MRLNREQLVAVVAFLVLVLGVYIELGNLRAPGVNVRLPDTAIPRTEGGIGEPEYRRFISQKPLLRDPFSTSGGWKALDLPALEAPPYSRMPRLLPLLERSAPPEEAGFLFQEDAER